MKYLCIRHWFLIVILLTVLITMVAVIPFDGGLYHQVYAQDDESCSCCVEGGSQIGEHRPVRSFQNPSAVYCDVMGYQYEIRIDSEGNEYGISIFPDGSECDAWDFFYGRAGKEFSYCSLYGYDIETEEVDKGTYSSKCAVCVPKEGDNMRGIDRIPMLELMACNGESLPGGASTSRTRIGELGKGGQIVKDTSYTGYGLPAAFDWRDKNGHSYIGGVRDQGYCGSCYAFAACAAAEGVYNWANGYYDENCVDFSEAFIIWCLGSLPQYNEHFYGCSGADYTYAELEAITAEGVCNEGDFQYLTTDPGECSHWDDRRITFNSWRRVPCGDVLSIKEAIMNFGPVDAAVWVGGAFYSYDNGIYQDSNTECWADPCYYTPTNHAISLVGWNDNGDADSNGYWILRNSWGSGWGEEGYMLIDYHSALISCEVCRLSYAVTSVGGEALPVDGYNKMSWYINLRIAIMMGILLAVRRSIYCR
jgi:C1A family cysteine protease